MADHTWKAQFKAAYERAAKAYDKGRNPAPEKNCIGDEDAGFLASIGCSRQELFDFVEDWCLAGEPSYDDVLAVTAIRRDYFLAVQGGMTNGTGARPAHEFPPKSAAVLDGIPWLPRLIAKARAKLRGQLPAELMYGCGGDRPFLQRAHLTLAEFLEAVRDAGDDDRPVVELLKRRSGRAN